MIRCDYWFFSKNACGFLCWCQLFSLFFIRVELK